jgi:hypothetical protein
MKLHKYVQAALVAAAIAVAVPSGLAAVSCCVKAEAEGKECTHQCCVDAHKAKKTCEKCQAKATCCDKAIAQAKDCEHKCCVEAAKAKKVCEKCNPKEEQKPTA